MRQWITLYLTVALFCVCSGCSTSGTARVDVDDDSLQDTKMSSQDLRTMARQMAEDILQCPQIKERIKQNLKPAKIALVKLTNDTRDYDFSPWETLTKIRGYLIQYSRGYITFLESEKLKEVVAESSGYGKPNDTESLFKSNPHLEQADYVLTGRAYTQEQRSQDKSSQYHNYTFWLTHVATRVIVWQNEYEAKKVSHQGLLYGRE